MIRSRLDAADLIAAILARPVTTGGDHMTTIPVSRIVTDSDAYSSHHDALEGCGIALSEERQGTRRPVLSGKRAIFFDKDRVRKYLLRGTPWHSAALDSILLAIPGAKRAQRMLGRHRVWGITIPLNNLTAKPASEQAPASEPAPAPHRWLYAIAGSTTVTLSSTPLAGAEYVTTTDALRMTQLAVQELSVERAPQPDGWWNSVV